MSNPIKIGIDARTFSYTNSVSRGIGHYTLNHIKNIVEKENDWNYILFTEENIKNELTEILQKYDNVEQKRYVDFTEGDINLFHIPDPMNTSHGFDSPLRIIQNIPTTILFHDLIPLYFYYDSWPEQIRKLYDLG